MAEREDYDGSYAVGSKNMEHLFKFVADNTDVEWSLASYETAEGHKDVLATSHDDTYVAVYSYEGNELGNMEHLDLTTRIHSHVDEHFNPSGFSPKDYIVKSNGDIVLYGTSDRMTADNIADRFKAAGKLAPSFYVYHTLSKTKVKYDGNKIYNLKK